MRVHRLLLSTVVAVLLAGWPATAAAQAPAGYYDAVDTMNAATLRATLHGVIDDHTRFPYTSTATDTWNVLEQADQDPGDASSILDVYKNASYVKQGGGNSFYNREHSWPKSYGFPDDNAANYPYTDCHALFLCDSSYNSSRSNKPYRDCDATCTEKTTEVNNGQGGSPGTYPGQSNWTAGSFTQGSWETWMGRRGDVARALFYLDVRYEGGVHGVTAVAEPDLVLTDDEALIDASNTGNNESLAYMGMLSTLLDWHAEDPVDALEGARNDAIFANQGNRNPFIDHPEWVDCIFSGSCAGAWTDIGFGLAGVGGVPGLNGSGTMQVGSANSFNLEDANPVALALLFVSFQSFPVPFKGGTLVAFPPSLDLIVTTDAAGSFGISVPSWPAGIPSGLSLYMHFAIADSAAPGGWRSATRSPARPPSRVPLHAPTGFPIRVTARGTPGGPLR